MSRLALAVFLALGIASCDSSESQSTRDSSPMEQHDGMKSGPIAATPGAPKPLPTVKRVQEKYSDQIFDAFGGVVGNGIGAAEEGSSPKPSDEAYVIVVYLEDGQGRPKGPRSVRGVPLRFKVTGAFKAY